MACGNISTGNLKIKRTIMQVWSSLVLLGFLTQLNLCNFLFLGGSSVLTPQAVTCDFFFSLFFFMDTNEMDLHFSFEAMDLTALTYFQQFFVNFLGHSFPVQISSFLD